MTTTRKLEGLSALAVDVVSAGSRAVEEIQKKTAARTFDVLERIPGIAPPARVVHVVFDAHVSVVHGAIRLVTRSVGRIASGIARAADRSE